MNEDNQGTTNPDDYNAEADVWNGVREAYRLIRDRVARGAPGWPQDAAE